MTLPAGGRIQRWIGVAACAVVAVTLLAVSVHAGGHHRQHRGYHGCTECESCGHHCCRDGLCGHCGHLAHGHHFLKHDTIEKRYFLRSQGKSWHSTWYDPSIGRPMALVVPPTAEFTSEYGWGVPSSRVMPIYHQFRRPYPGPGAVPGSGGAMLPTPNQPSDTVQFGVHPVRGPWGAY
ncbi:MAG: hypothetical protein WCR51_06155 [Planctomycetia bacterium]